MTEQEIRQLLAVAVAYDNRKPGAANIAAWLEAAHRGRWTFAAALDAIHAHYAESAEFLMPAHITARVKQNRQHPAPYAALPPASPADEETRQRVTTMVRAFGKRFAVSRAARRERRPAPLSAEHAMAREAARAELSEVRRRQSEDRPP